MCVVSAPKIVFRGAGLAAAEYSCPHPWQTAYLRFLCPQKKCLEGLGLPMLSICVVVLGRLPICVFSAPEIVFRGAGLAYAEYLCCRPWQTADLLLSAPKNVFRGAGLAEAEYLCRRPWQTAYLRFLCPPILFLQVLGLPTLSICVVAPWLMAYLRVVCPKKILQLLGLLKLILCVVVLGRLPICVFSAPPPKLF